MNKFEEAIASIDARIAKQKADVSRLAEVAAKKLNELCVARKELVQNIKTILEREASDGDFVFSIEEGTWEIIDEEENISIERNRHGTSDRTTLYTDIKFINIESLQDLQDAVRLLEVVKSENNRIEETLNAYIQFLNIRADRVERAIQKLEPEYGIVD